MYEGHFKLQGRPFLAAPLPRRYVGGAVIDGARQTLVRCIERGEGPALVIGPPGTGKSMLCHVLCDELRHRFAVALLVNSRFASRTAFLQAILYELGVGYRGLVEGELRLALLDYLDPVAGAAEGLLLVIDEAHVLPWRLLEEVRMLTNLVRDGKPRVRAVLAGSAALEERFASPKLTSFSQRLAARCYLGPLDAGETAAYVRAQIAAVGGDSIALFDDDALRAVYRATDGTPRLINQVCDHAMILACLGGRERLDAAAIEEAWADLQQLPTPWNAASQRPAGEHDDVIEFGALDDEAESRFDAIPFPANRLAPPRLHGDAPAIAPAQTSSVSDGILGGPEVELDFPEFGDPLAEEFLHEEVVLDTYAADIALFEGLPRVDCNESGRIAELLAPCVVADNMRPAPQIRLRPPGDAAPAPRRTSGPQRVEPIAAPPAPAPQAVRHDAPAADAVRPAMTTVRGTESPLGDRQILVVEETEFVVTHPPQSHAAPPRKSEFRQLFAKLRRG